MTQTQVASHKTSYTIRWEKLPDDFQLPDEPVENIYHPLLASALREILEIAGFITPSMLIADNFGICATVDGKIVMKAPDWVYVPNVLPVVPGVIRRSYTTHAEGDVPPSRENTPLNPLIPMENGTSMSVFCKCQFMQFLLLMKEL